MRLTFLMVLLAGTFIFLQYRLWFEAGGIRDMWKLKQTLALQSAENDKFKERNQELLAQIERLQNSNEATESRARNELGMIKKGETFYQIVNKDNP